MTRTTVADWLVTPVSTCADAAVFEPKSMSFELAWSARALYAVVADPFAFSHAMKSILLRPNSGPGNLDN